VVILEIVLLRMRGGGGEVQVEWEDFEGAAAEPENEYALVDDGDE